MNRNFKKFISKDYRYKYKRNLLNILFKKKKEEKNNRSQRIKN